MESCLTLTYTHAQLSVFQAGTEDPFNDWTPEHNDQGFAWRPGSVSFGTLDDGGTITIAIRTAEKWVEDTKAVRIIAVPFVVGDEGIEVASIVSGEQFAMPEGVYELFFEIGRSECCWCRLTFVTNPDAKARIIKADDGLKPPRNLNMKALPA